METLRDWKEKNVDTKKPYGGSMKLIGQLSFRLTCGLVTWKKGKYNGMDSL